MAEVKITTPPPFFLLLHADHLCAIDETVVHAVETVEFVRWERDRTDDGNAHNPALPTVCGQTAVIDWQPVEDGPAQPFGWPCRVSALRNGAVRCCACHEATGKRRPHKDWADG